MEGQKLKVVFRRGSLWLKIAVLALVLLSMAALLTICVFNQQAKQERDALRKEAVQLEAENAGLSAAIEQLGTIKGIFQIAREELGLIEPDSIIIEPTQ